MEPWMLKLIADNDQDLEHCRQWWREADAHAKLVIWNVIQHPYTDPRLEVMSRFAQLAFGQMAEEQQRAKSDSSQA